MAERTAKLFMNGGSQAVRLPADFRFDGLKEVYIRRDPGSNEVVLSPKPLGNTWSDFFVIRAQARVPRDFMTPHGPEVGSPEDRV